MTAGATGGAKRSCKQQIPAKATPFIIMMKSQSNVVQTLVGPGRRGLLIVKVCVPALLPLVSGMRALGLTGLLTEGSQGHSSQDCRRLDQRCEGYARRKDGFKIAGRQIRHLSRQGRKLQVISVRATTRTHEHVESSQACPSDCYRDEFHVKASRLNMAWEVKASCIKLTSRVHGQSYRSCCPFSLHDFPTEHADSHVVLKLTLSAFQP